jgi:hypothetical protein
MVEIKDPVFDRCEWFSYLHVNGAIITKRYLSWGDYKEAGDSDFVVMCTRIYSARDMLAAKAEGIRQIRGRFQQ